jgi:hypothetical protein
MKAPNWVQHTVLAGEKWHMSIDGTTKYSNIWDCVIPTTTIFLCSFGSLIGLFNLNHTGNTILHKRKMDTLTVHTETQGFLHSVHKSS